MYIQSVYCEDNFTFILFFCNRFLARDDTILYYCDNVLLNSIDTQRRQQFIDMHTVFSFNGLKWNKQINVLKDETNSHTNIHFVFFFYRKWLYASMSAYERSFKTNAPGYSAVCPVNQQLFRTPEESTNWAFFMVTRISFSSLCTRVPIIFHFWKIVKSKRILLLLNIFKFTEEKTKGI